MIRRGGAEALPWPCSLPVARTTAARQSAGMTEQVVALAGFVLPAIGASSGNSS